MIQKSCCDIVNHRLYNTGQTFHDIIQSVTTQWYCAWPCCERAEWAGWNSATLDELPADIFQLQFLWWHQTYATSISEPGPGGQWRNCSSCYFLDRFNPEVGMNADFMLTLISPPALLLTVTSLFLCASCTSSNTATEQINCYMRWSCWMFRIKLSFYASHLRKSQEMWSVHLIDLFSFILFPSATSLLSSSQIER